MLPAIQCHFPDAKFRPSDPRTSIRKGPHYLACWDLTLGEIVKATVEFAIGDWKTEVVVECEGVSLGSPSFVIVHLDKPQSFLADILKELRLYFPQEKNFSWIEKRRLGLFIRAKRQQLPCVLRSGKTTVKILGYE
jgi:hypothetical protein